VGGSNPEPAARSSDERQRVRGGRVERRPAVAYQTVHSLRKPIARGPRWRIMPMRQTDCPTDPGCPLLMDSSLRPPVDRPREPARVRRPAPPLVGMLSCRAVRTLLVWLSVGLLVGLWPVAAQVQVLITNQDLAPHELSQNEARLYFGMRLQRWPDHQPVKVFVLPDDHPLHSDFAKGVLGMFPYQLRSAWDRQLFSGTGQAPTRVADEQAMIRRVASTPGAIGYARTNPQDARVHVLKVH
jgi:hypothetical protein